MRYEVLQMFDFFSFFLDTCGARCEADDSKVVCFGKLHVKQSLVVIAVVLKWKNVVSFI